MDFLALMREERKKLLSKTITKPESSKPSISSTGALQEQQTIRTALANDDSRRINECIVGSSAKSSNDVAPSNVEFSSFEPIEQWKRFAGVFPSSQDWLEKYRVAPHLDSVFYVPDYVDETEHQAMLKQVASPAAKWVHLRSRSLQAYGGDKPGPDMVPEPLPPWLTRLSESLVDSFIFSEDHRPNHVLLNQYQPGEGILAHSDGPIYHPLVACLSLGAPCILTFCPQLSSAEVGVKSEAALCKLVLEPRSLVVFRGDAYTSSVHGLDPCWAEPVTSDINNLHLCKGVEVGDTVHRGKRVSLTVRQVLCSTAD